MHNKTPIYRSFQQSNALGKDIYYKMDCHQPSGSFKIRGIGLLCREKRREGITHFVIASGGNAGLALAYSGYRLGVEVTVVVPESTKETMRERIRLLGARLEVQGESWLEAHNYAMKLAEKADPECRGYVHPFDHPTLWRGHASLIEEAAEQLEEQPDLVIVAVGGGGLFCGIMEGLEKLGWQNTKVLCVETEGAASLYKSIEVGHQVTLEQINTVATSLGAKRICDQAWAYAQLPSVAAATVNDEEAIAACRSFASEYLCIVEPACGAALAMLNSSHPFLQAAQRILVVICGGSGYGIDNF